MHQRFRSCGLRGGGLFDQLSFNVPAHVVRTQSPAPGGDYDCMAGKKQWRWYLDRAPQ